MLAAASFGAIAETLTPDEALERAMGATQTSPALKSLVGKVERPKLLRTVASPEGVPAAYLFGREAGYVVVAADDVALPLLGYSDEPLSAEAEMPVQMRWWLDQYGRQIDYARARHSSKPALVMPQSRADRAPIAPLLSTQWNQDAPYNDLCPEINGKRAVTGCVATAMAQVMKYHNYPAKGTSSISYKLNGQTLSMDFSKTTFDWANMLDDYTGSYTTAQSTAVATLMKACGYATQMQYTATESGTATIYAAQALRTYFGYDAALELKDRDYYPLDQWEEMCYQNLRDCGPVLYGGTDYARTAGHEFICDGYSANGYFHFNWGWGGAYDGYFLLTALNPAGVGIGGGLGDGFNFMQDAIFGVQPPTGATVKYDNRLTVYGTLAGSISKNVITLSAGTNGAFINNTDRTFGAQVGVKIVNAAGQASYVSGASANSIQPFYGLTDYSVTLPSMPDGTYKVYPVCRPTGNGASTAWLDMYQKVGAPDYLVLSVSGSTYTVATADFENPKASNVKAQTALYAGRAYEITADLTNVAPFEMYMPVASGFATLSNNQLNLLSAGDVMLVDLNAGATKNYTFTGTVGKSNTPAGQYYFIIYNPDTNDVLFYTTVSVAANPGNPSLNCSSFTLAGGTSNANAASLTFNATVKVSSGYLDKSLILAFFESTGDTSIDATTMPVKYLSAGQSATFSTTYNFTMGQVGKSYLVGLFDPYNTSNMLSYLTFTVGTSGVDNVASETSISINVRSTSVDIEAPAGIASIEAFRVDGGRVAVPSVSGVSSVALPTDIFTPGVYAVRVTDASGHCTTQKIVVR